MNECKFETISVDDNQLLENAEIRNEISQKNVFIIDLKDVSKICRTCMNSADIMFPILESILQNDIKLSDLLLECASIQVNSSDSLPLNICNNCLVQILQIHNFRKQCNDVEQCLKELLQSVTKLAKPKVDEFSFDYEQIDLKIDEKTPREVIIKQEAPVTVSKRKKRIKKVIRKSRWNREYKCRDCEEIFKLRTVLLAHLKETKHSELRSLKCELCDKRFTKKSNLKVHMRSHTKEKPYQCKLCVSSFALKSNLLRHVNGVHIGERPHVCQYCGKSFSQLVTLKTHNKIHTDIFNLDKPYLNRINKTNKQEAKKNKIATKETDTKLHVCEICNKRYKSKNILNFHLIKHGEKTFLCSICGKSFYTNSCLNKHHTVHTGERAFTCTICSKSFAQHCGLSLHMRIHSGFKPHQCHLCPKTFTQKQQLRSHLLTHSGIRQYTCNYCDKSFAFKCILTDHIRTHTREPFCSCPVCGKEFYCRSNFRKHKKSHEGENKVVSTNEIVLASEQENVNSSKSK